MNFDFAEVKQIETVQSHSGRKHTKKQDKTIAVRSAWTNKIELKAVENVWKGNKTKSNATENAWSGRTQKTRSGAIGAPSTCNLANAKEARPIAEEEQRVWFGSGGEKDLALVSCQAPF